MKNIKNKKLFWALLISILLITFPLVGKTFQNDTFFTIPTGNYILENGINDVEPFTWHDNLKFTKLRWAFDISVAGIFNISGYTGLYICTVVIAELIATTLFITMNKKGINKIVSFAITIFTMATLTGGLTCRAQIVSYLLFAFEMYSIQQLMDTNKRKYSVYLILISIGILSFHSSVWLAYFIFYIPYIVEWVIYKLNIHKIFEKSDKIIVQKHKIVPLLITMVISLLCGIISPLGISNFTYMPKVIGGISSEIILELQSLMIEENKSLIVVVMILFIITAFTKAKIKFTDLCYICGFLIMATLAERNVFISIVALAIPIGNLISSLIKEYNKEELIETINSKINKWSWVAIIILISTYIMLVDYQDVVDEKYVDTSSYPVKASEYIKNNIDMENMRLYNHFNFGSYLELQGIPTFMDSRSEIYCEEFNNTTILRDFRDLEINHTITINDMVEKYNITHIICYSNSNYANDLRNSENYEELYDDFYFAIYRVVE